jgi:hypothetical protein
MNSNERSISHGDPLRPARPVPDPEFRALLVKLVDALRVTSSTVDDLVEDLTSDRWERSPRREVL